MWIGVSHTLKDIRLKAEGRARQKVAQAGPNTVARPPGSGFMSERTRAKEALRVEVNTYTGENVRKIAATSAAAQEDRILRVAAYCRVSTDDIDQLVSIELQKNNYRDMIKANPKWKYVGTYVDDGFSGTNTEHRPAFQLMMKDAMAGRIDMIGEECSAIAAVKRSMAHISMTPRKRFMGMPPLSILSGRSSQTIAVKGNSAAWSTMSCLPFLCCIQYREEQIQSNSSANKPAKHPQPQERVSDPAAKTLYDLNLLANSKGFTCPPISRINGLLYPFPIGKSDDKRHYRMASPPVFIVG